LTRLIYDQAKSAAHTSSDQGARYATAALALAAQDEFIGGTASAENLLRRYTFSQISGISSSEINRLRRNIADHEQLRGLCSAYLRTAASAIGELQTSERDLRVMQNLGGAVDLASARPDIQLQIAELYRKWLMTEDAAARVGAVMASRSWRSSIASDAFSRWLDVAEASTQNIKHGNDVVVSH